MLQVCQRVEGVCYDLEYNTQAIQSMSKVSQFPHISSLLAKAVELKTRLNTVSQPESNASRARGTEWTSSSLASQPEANTHRARGTEWNSSSLASPTLSTHSITHPHTHSEPSIQAAPVSQSTDDELKPKQFD